MSNIKVTAQKFLIFTLLFIFITNVSIYLDIPFLRQIFSFIFLTLLPGILILKILRLTKLNFLEKFVLSWGISISFVMLFGLFVNSVSLIFGYDTPLYIHYILWSFNILLLALAIINYAMNKNDLFSIPDSNLKKLDWLIVILSLILPLMSILGVNLMESIGNNIILMLLFVLIPFYVFVIMLFRDEFPKKMYPLTIFSISLSLLLLMGLRSNHIMGADIHLEYYIFYNTLLNNQWSILGTTTLDACISVSLLPAIYQKMMNINPEFLFKFLYVLLFSISPLIVYLISNKYVKKEYSFLAAFFFMSQSSFLLAEINPRTNMAILFFMLAIMVFFSKNLDMWRKKLIFIVFMTTCIISHYSTSYIFFIMLMISSLVALIYKKRSSIQTVISSNLIILFFSIMFVWYGQITGKAFNSGINFIISILENLLFRFFIEESRGTQVQALAGQNIINKGISAQIEFVFTWILLAVIMFGVISVLMDRDKVLLLKTDKFDYLKPKLNYLKERMDFEYFIMALVCCILLAVTVIIPGIAKGYSMDRLYLLTSSLLAVFFIIGGIKISRILKKIIPRNKNIDSKSSSSVFLILIVLIPYFMCVNGFVYNITGENRSVLLNSNVESYFEMYILDGESNGAKWLGDNRNISLKSYTDHTGRYQLISQGKFFGSIDEDKLQNTDLIKGYIYLRNRNIHGLFVGRNYTKLINNDTYSKYNLVYDNGDSQVLINQFKV